MVYFGSGCFSGVFYELSRNICLAHSDSNAQQLVYLCCGMYLVKTVASIYSYSREHVQSNGIIMLM